MRALAADLGYEAVRDFCFAHRDAQVAAEAMLRGPLFIDGDAVIDAGQIHFGPAWLDGGSGRMTVPAGDTFGEAPAGLSRGAGRGEYFTGPAAHRQPVYEMFKRVFDVMFALFALTVTLPICLAVALVIKVSDRGPIFFKHRREGARGRPFECMKFRTMVRNAEAMKSKLRGEPGGWSAVQDGGRSADHGGGAIFAEVEH